MKSFNRIASKNKKSLRQAFECYLKVDKKSLKQMTSVSGVVDKSLSAAKKELDYFNKAE